MTRSPRTCGRPSSSAFPKFAGGNPTPFFRRSREPDLSTTKKKKGNKDRKDYFEDEGVLDHNATLVDCLELFKELTSSPLEWPDFWPQALRDVYDRLLEILRERGKEMTLTQRAYIADVVYSIPRVAPEISLEEEFNAHEEIARIIASFCGDCGGKCCRIPPVYQINPKAGEEEYCFFFSDGRCAIYVIRPWPCRMYVCPALMNNHEIRAIIEQAGLECWDPENEFTAP